MVDRKWHTHNLHIALKMGFAWGIRMVTQPTGEVVYEWFSLPRIARDYCNDELMALVNPKGVGRYTYLNSKRKKRGAGKVEKEENASLPKKRTYSKKVKIEAKNDSPTLAQ